MARRRDAIRPDGVVELGVKAHADVAHDHIVFREILMTDFVACGACFVFKTIKSVGVWAGEYVLERGAGLAIHPSMQTGGGGSAAWTDRETGNAAEFIFRYLGEVVLNDEWRAERQRTDTSCTCLVDGSDVDGESVMQQICCGSLGVQTDGGHRHTERGTTYVLLCCCRSQSTIKCM